MPLNRTKKTILAFLTLALLAPVVLLSVPKRADAQPAVPTQEVINWPNVALFAAENAIYGLLKFGARTLADFTSNEMMKHFTGGYVGQQPAWNTLNWLDWAQQATNELAAGAAEGFFLGLESMNRAKEAGIGDMGKERDGFLSDADRERQEAAKIENTSGYSRAIENLTGKEDELQAEWDAKNCSSNTELFDCKEIRKDIDSLEEKYEFLSEYAERNIDPHYSKANELEKKASSISSRISQFNASEGDRFLKYQKNRAGALSSNATSILRRACNPNFGLEFNIGLGLASPLDINNQPICRVTDLYKNWTGAIQGTGVAISDIIRQTGQNPWQTLSDAIDPRKSNLGIALAIHQNIIDEQIQAKFALENERFISDILGVKNQKDFGGNITTPAPYLAALQKQVIGNESDIDKRLTGKLIVDGIDIGLTFLGTLFGNSMKLAFDGLRKKANEVNAQLAGAEGSFEGGEFIPTPVSSSAIYNPDAAPQNFAPQEVIARRSAQLAKVKTTSGDYVELFAELQSANCNLSANACTFGPATALAVQDRLTIGEAMKKYRESGGNIGLNPLGVFGFTSRSTSDKPVQPTDYKINYPYNSMVVMRKYRILPVAWELAALYIRDHSQDKDGGPCDNRDCTLQDLVNNFDNKSSPFYRLVDPNWVLKLPQVQCALKGYGPAALKSGTIQEQDPVLRQEVCLDERTWLHEGTPQDWQRAEKSINNDDYGYCVEEKKVFQISGTQCKRAFSSCDTFTELGRDGKNAKTQFFLKDSLATSTFATDQNTDNVCKADNAGCSWLSTARRQYETCIFKVTVEKGQGDVDYVKKRELLENKTLKSLWSQDIDITQATPKRELTYNWRNDTESGKKYSDVAALCGTIREGRPDGSTFTTAQEWTAATTARVFLSYKAQQCSAEFEGCRDLGDGNYLKIAPAYLKCDESNAWQRGECQRYALHCTADTVGCQLYQPESRFESPVTATTPLACVSGQCVGLDNYLLQPSPFNPAASTAFYAFKASAVQSCNAQSSGCEEFTNLAQERTGAEARTYFTNAISCEQKPANERTVFYSYFGSEQGGRQPMPYSLKPNGINASVPDCVPGYTCTGTSTIAIVGNTVVCDDAILTQQYYNSSAPPVCREFIAANGTVSYRLVDKLIYQTDDCTQYRRSQDQQEYAYSTGMSRQCAPQYKGCRTYISTQAGNYKLVVRDAFDQSQGVAGWQLPEGTTDYTAETSLESENVGGRSMRIQKKSGAPTSYEVQKGVTIQQDYTYTFTLTARAQTGNTLTAALNDLAGGVSQSLGSHTFSASGWQYITFTATSSPAFSTATSTLSLVFSKGTASSLGSGANNAVYVDNIYLKEASGKTVYAIDTSISSDEARPVACRTADSGTADDESDDIYQTGCQFYNDRAGRSYVDADNKRVAHYGFQNVCPAAFVGCKGYPTDRFYITLRGANDTIDTGSAGTDYINFPVTRNLPSGIARCNTDVNHDSWDASPYPGYNQTSSFAAQLSDPLVCYDEYSVTGYKRYAIYKRQRYLVDEPKARCNDANKDCTAYGFPKAIQESIDTSGSTATTTEDIQSQYSTTARKEAWQTLYFKITPEMIAASSTDPKAHEIGICKQQEVGCKAYDTAASKRYFKDPGKNVCQFFDTTPSGAKGQPERQEGGSGGWFYKSCGKISDNLLNATYMNALDYPYFSCRTDSDCAGLNDKYPRTDGSDKVPVYTEKCDSYISCELEKDKFGNVTDANKPVGPTYNASASSSIDPLQDADAKAYWIASGPVSYAKQCTAKVSGCTEYEDPDCRPCGAGNEYCADPDPTKLKGTLITDYGRFNPQKGEPGTACRTKYYYIKTAEKTGAQECRNQLDPENGCVLFRSTNQDAPDLKYNSTYYYGAYNNSKRAIAINQADTNNGTSMYSGTSIPPQYGADVKDANVLLKAKLDRECSTPLVCSEEQASGGAAQCTQRLPCLIINEFGGCASIGFSARKACEGSNPLFGCAVDADCRGVAGTSPGARCVEVGVCSNNPPKRCTGDTECGGSNKCLKQVDAPYFAQLNTFCNQQTEEDTCNANIDCFWNPLGNDTEGGDNCRAKDTASLVAAFDAPKIQTVDTVAKLNLNFSMLSGYARPAMRFAAGQTPQAQSVLHRDSFFDWSVQEGSGVSITSDSSKIQSGLDLGPYKVANSCRLYPSTGAPEQQAGKWNDACNYKSAGAEGDTWNIGLYGYCLEPYPRFATQFKQQWVGPGTDPKTLYRVDQTLATSTDAAIATIHGGYRATGPGDYAYNAYRNSCLLWYPSDKLAAQTQSGLAGAANLSATAYTGDNDVFVCIEESNPTENSSNVATADKSSATGYSYNPYNKDNSRDHSIYETYSSTCNYYSGACTTRDSSSWRKTGGNLAEMTGDDDSRTTAAMNNDTNVLIVATELKSDIVNQIGATAAVIIMAGSGGCGVGTVVGSVVPVIGNAIGCASGAVIGGVGGLIWGIVAGGRGTDDTRLVIPLNGMENPKGLGNSLTANGAEIHFDAIEKIEYSFEAASRHEFRELFNGKEKWGDCLGNQTQCEKTWRLGCCGVQADANQRAEPFKTLWHTDKKKPVAFFYQEKGRDVAWCDGSSSRGDSLCALQDTESFFQTFCDNGKNFVVVGPVVDNDILRGWRWRYCDKNGSNQTEAVAVSVKIVFKKPNHTVNHLVQDEYTNYCKTLVRVAGQTSTGQTLAVSKYSKVGDKTFTQSNSYLPIDTKNFLLHFSGTLNKAKRLSYLAKRYLWDVDDYYIGTTQYQIQHSAYGISSSKWSGKEKLLPGSTTGGVLQWFYQSDNPSTGPSTTSSVSYPTVTDTANTPGALVTYRAFYKDTLDNVRNLFGKVYEIWRWNGSQYEKKAFYDPSTRLFSGSSASDVTLLTNFWNTSKTNAQAGAPVIYRAYQNTEKDHESEYSFLPPIPSLPLSVKAGISAGGFTLEHNKRAIYQNVKIRFYVGVNDDQLPMRKLIVDWGDYVSGRSVFEDKNDENTGKKDNPGTANFTTTAPPYTFSHMYRDRPVGKTICIYAMDNWEAKSAVCGTITKKANGDLTISNFVTKRGTQYDININPTAWPPTDKGRCVVNGGIAHNGTYSCPSGQPTCSFACPF